MKRFVKCLDNSNHSYGHRLKVGNVYEVLNEIATPIGRYIYLKGIMTDGGTMIEWSTNRFDDADNEHSSERTTLTDLRVAAQVIDPNIDHEEERCRSVLLGPAKGNCPCNILLETCWIHNNT